MKALALTGGGAKGAYQIGVLKKIMGDDCNDYNIITGVSVGALHIALLSQFPLGQPQESIKHLENFWLNNVTTENVYRRWFPFGKLHGLWKKSMYDSSPLHELLRKTVKPELVRSNGRSLAVGAVNLNTGRSFYARETHSQFIEYMLASSSFPVFFSPIEIDNQLWSDGGVKEVTPLGQAIKMGATEIDVITTEKDLFGHKGWFPKSQKAFPNQLLRTIELMQHRMLKRDIEITKLKNDLSKLNDKYKRVNVRIIVPSENLVENSLVFERSDIERMISIGYHDACNFITL